MSNRSADRFRRFHAATILTLAISTLGCGSGVPFDLVPVQGKVTYDDGSLIEADSILITFNPINEAPAGKIAPPGGTTYANVQDGTFSSVSSHRKDDGVVVGRHKVVVVAFRNGPNGNPAPTRAVPSVYHKVASTPLEVEIVSPDQNVELKVSKR